MQPRERSLREQIKRLQAENARLGTANDELRDESENLNYDCARHSEVAANLKDLLLFCRQSGSVPSLEVLEQCLEGKHLSHLITDMSTSQS